MNFLNLNKIFKTVAQLLWQ